MPRYFFHIYHQHDRPDTEGTDLPNDEEAWNQATRTCGQMIRDLDGALQAGPEWRMEVQEEDGEPLYTVRFSAEAHKR